MAVFYYEQHVASGLTQKRTLSRYLNGLIGKYLAVKKITLTYIFCDDAYLLEINQGFLKHNTYTDIITFDLSDTEDDLAGEIYISVERVRENAGKFNTSYNTELHRVIFHGALHLCGFKDKAKADKKNMRDAEDRCLKEYLGKPQAVS